MTPVHSNLSALRQLRKLTQQQLADEIGVTRQTIHNIEHAYKVPSLEVALRLAAFFRVHVEDLFLLGDRSPKKSAIKERAHDGAQKMTDPD